MTGVSKGGAGLQATGLPLKTNPGSLAAIPPFDAEPNTRIVRLVRSSVYRLPYCVDHVTLSTGDNVAGSHRATAPPSPQARPRPAAFPVTDLRSNSSRLSTSYHSEISFILEAPPKSPVLSPWLLRKCAEARSILCQGSIPRISLTGYKYATRRASQSVLCDVRWS